MKAKCPIDGVEFEVHSYQHKYCSDRCRLIAFHLNKLSGDAGSERGRNR
jgi:endogenous inhibitor of DNA gyrase (YacG/DUF329 family)